MKKNVLFMVMLSIVLAYGFVVVGCNQPTGSNGGTLVPPETPEIDPVSVDQYADLEPALAPNPSMLTVKEGGDVQIDALALFELAEPSSSVRSAGSAYSFTYTSLNPDIATVSSTGIVHALLWGNVRISVTYNGQTVYVNIYIVPPTPFYHVPISYHRLVSAGFYYNSSAYTGTIYELGNFTTEPTNRLAWMWRNPTTSYGASGTNCGIDIIGKVDTNSTGVDRWGGTTYRSGGWQYNLNGVDGQMTNGVQTSSNGVTLTLEPSFIYDNGVPYLEITHKLKNTSGVTVTDQKFGAAADVMMSSNDYAPLTYLPYGVLMTDTYYGYAPTIKLRLICQGVEGVTDVDSLWLGHYGRESSNVYTDKRDDVTGIDSALAFSYQDITLSAGEEKSYVIRFTLAR